MTENYSININSNPIHNLTFKEYQLYSISQNLQAISDQLEITNSLLRILIEENEVKR